MFGVVLSVSSEAFCATPFTPGPGGFTAGPLTSGCTAPPMTSSTVLTTVLFVVARGWSQLTKSLNVWTGTASGSLPPTWWNVICTQPPLCVSAFVTAVCRSASVQVLSTWSRALR